MPAPTDVQPAAAAEPPGQGAAAEAAAARGSAEPAAGAEPAFSCFVGHRRPLPPDAELFEAGNAEREELARQSAVAAVRDERRQLGREAGLAADPLLVDHRFECHQCHASLPTARLLDIHVSELHDSFFAAQAARRMPVYLCLVDGCARKFCTVEERKQHLQDHHKFPRHFHFDRMHLRRKKAQIRPLPQFQKGHGRQAMAADQQQQPAAAAAAAGADQQQQQGGQQAAAAAGHGGGDELAAGMSRLSMAAEASSVPAVIHFGRQGRGRGLVGPGRGRGRGGRGGRGGGAGAQARGGAEGGGAGAQAGRGAEGGGAAAAAAVPAAEAAAEAAS